MACSSGMRVRSLKVKWKVASFAVALASNWAQPQPQAAWTSLLTQAEARGKVKRAK